MINHIGILTSGGDAPGMNAALYGVVKTAQHYNIKVSGIKKGYEGLISNDLISLDIRTLQSSMHLGGTILKTARCDVFKTDQGRACAINTINKNKIDALIIIGGDGSFKGALWLAQKSNIQLIGIPGTIDNDLAGTDFTLGFDTAVNTSMQCIDKIRDTAESHNRVFVIEVMGRDSGYIAAYSGLTSGADSFLIPESRNDIESLLNNLDDFHSDHALIVVVAEGDEIGTQEVCKKIKSVNPNIDLRLTKLGHLQRGGNPTASDRMLAIGLGSFSVHALLENKSGMMVGIINNRYCLTKFAGVIKKHEISEEVNKLLAIFCR
ncbi:MULTISPECIES: ATP-dependent 6-phosphofructokinase [unclassified Pseudoalteromonas]|uniref:ATP-dependent 6-phosphofructokinase n=1 Tax=unclassified Pseudoalteromonas TaxID=194690 RepID=UPI000C08871F|nr:MULTISPECIES: ATP-dependent 6-phosphofructokinase [unclassified Pseudoalteromonas]MDP2634662.1 ATP-dependent 6-phosphofructokinase [Pseudoalteromonas sp. 1_MG-2023]PHN91197.1 6-phosphofructokinase [Pseudoalteromonas sp. 3D05]